MLKITLRGNHMNVPAVRISNVPVITIYVRHSKDCDHRGEEFYRRCRCPKHLRWFDKKLHRTSAKTRSWAKAEERRREVEAQYEAANYVNNPKARPIDGVRLETKSSKTIEQVIELFVSDKGSQGCAPDGLKKYTLELGRFSEFMAKRSKFFPHQITLADLTEYRADWLQLYPSPTTRSKVQERLRAFLRYCYELHLLDRVPKLSPIKVDEPPTLPLTGKQYARLLKVIPDEFPQTKATRVRALIQLMRHSGLAIRDAVTLERNELRWDSRAKLHRVVTSRQKTNVHVSVAIPPDVATEIIAAMSLNENSRYAFWNTGTGKEQSAVTNWQHDLRQCFRAAGMDEGHPHQLRDSFAVTMLEKGVPLEDVSKMLGHDSIRTTERYYAKWVKSRQDRLDSLVVATWTTTPTPTTPTKKGKILKIA
jgi:site-specific recombinase XerD